MTAALGVHTSTAGAVGTGGSLTTSGISPSTGDTFIIAGSSDALPATMIDSTLTNIYTRVSLTDSTFATTWLYYCQNATAAAGMTAKGTWTASDSPTLHFFSITGVLAASFDKSRTGTATASPYTGIPIPSAGAFTVTDEIIILVTQPSGGSNPATMAESTGFNIIERQENNASFDASDTWYKVNTGSSAALTPSVTATGAARLHMVMASFMPTTGGGGRGLFQQTPMNGLGVGGSFFSNPIGKMMDRYKRSRGGLLVPA